MKEMFKDTAILFVITLISGLVLGFVYDLTKEPIAAQEMQKKNEAYKDVFPEADSFDELTDADSAEATALVLGKGYDAAVEELAAAYNSSGELLGYVITVTDHEGYGGDITFAMGIDREGICNGVSILSIAETAGLGMRAEEVLVPQMAGKDLKEEIAYTKSGNATEKEVDAISGATITTSAFINGVNAGRCVFTEMLQGKGES